jgi:nitrite reductase (NADH) small subunit
MPTFVPVATTGDIPVGQARAYVVGDREVAIFNLGGDFYAIENACPHQGGPLAEGWFENGVVTCPWHAWCFNVRSGTMTLGGFTSVDTFDVQVEGSTISVSDAPRT